MTEIPFLSTQPIYSPSLLVRLLPNLESTAEATYTPLLASSGLRPMKAPEGAPPLLPRTPTELAAAPTQMAAMGNMAGVTNPQVPYNQEISTIPDPATLTYYNTLANQMASPNANPPFLPNQPESAKLGSALSKVQSAMAEKNPVIGSIPMTEKQQLQTLYGNPNATIGSMLTTLLQNNPKMPSDLNRLLSVNPNAKPITASTAPARNMASFAAFNPNADSVNGRMLLPTGQQLTQVIGYEKLLTMLNQVDPTQFSAFFIQYAPRSSIMTALNNLSYNDVMAVWGLLSLPDKVSALGMMGIPPGEALSIAEMGMYGMGVPPFANAVMAGSQKRRIAIPAENMQNAKSLAYI